MVFAGSSAAARITERLCNAHTYTVSNMCTHGKVCIENAKQVGNGVAAKGNSLDVSEKIHLNFHRDNLIKKL